MQVCISKPIQKHFENVPNKQFSLFINLNLQKQKKPMTTTTLFTSFVSSKKKKKNTDDNKHKTTARTIKFTIKCYLLPHAECLIEWIGKTMRLPIKMRKSESGLSSFLPFLAEQRRRSPRKRQTAHTSVVSQPNTHGFLNTAMV